jgi:PAS domain S-box-containing protein
MKRRFWHRVIGSWNPLPTAASARGSVRGKLMRVVLVTTAIAVAVAGVAMLTHDLTVYRQSWAVDLSNEADILALSTAPALAFDDHVVAERNLSALRVRPRVKVAAIYSQNGNLYASYVREGASAPAHVPPIAGVRVNGWRIEVAKAVVRSGESLGTIYLRAEYDVLPRVVTYLEIFALVTVLSMLVAYAFSRRLQTVITEPLEAMTSVAHNIVSRRDYSLRAQKTTDDEIGVVVVAFNSMLDEVEARSRALHDEIAVRESAEAALGIATARLESTMAAAEIGSWVWDVRSNHFAADRNLAALYGLENEYELNGDPMRHRRQIHAEDLPSVRAAEEAAMTSGVLASTEFRVTLPNGTERWMARRGKVQLDSDGKAIFISGVLIDITAQKIAERALRSSEKLYRAIGESIDYGVWLCDPQGRNMYASESFLKLLGMTQEQYSTLGWGKVLHPDDAAATAAAWLECMRFGRVWYREHRVLGVDGRYHPILAQGVPIKDEGGAITGWAGINLDISQLKATEEALRDADRRKDEFLATLAHELRNPLAPIRHAVKLLETKSADDNQQKWARDIIGRQVQRMALLLDDLLDVSRITRGRLDLKLDIVDLHAIIDAAVETARPMIDSKQQRLTVQLPPNAMQLNVDSLRLSQSLSNLLTNATKYTDPGGRIALGATVTPDEIILSVKDSGIGLDPKTIPGLFEMFSQVDSAIDRTEGGLGIGLALVKGLVALHGGTVEGISAGIGHGSEFAIRLPRALVVTQSSASASAPAPDRADREVSGARGKILVADDNRDAADTLSMLLEISGYEVLVAHTGAQALLKAEESNPDAVILDIGMPDMTGYEVARRIRAEPWGKHVFLLAVTGWGQEEDKARAIAAGFDQHMTKPVDPDMVEQQLQSFFRRGDRPSHG